MSRKREFCARTGVLQVPGMMSCNSHEAEENVGRGRLIYRERSSPPG
jgi:hypothetical protein